MYSLFRIIRSDDVLTERRHYASTGSSSASRSFEGHHRLCHEDEHPRVGSMPARGRHATRRVRPGGRRPVRARAHEQRGELAARTSAERQGGFRGPCSRRAQAEALPCLLYLTPTGTQRARQSRRGGERTLRPVGGAPPRGTTLPRLTTGLVHRSQSALSNHGGSADCFIQEVL